jgi:hypothetical protein
LNLQNFIWTYIFAVFTHLLSAVAGFEPRTSVAIINLPPFILIWKRLPVANTLAYYTPGLLTTVENYDTSLREDLNLLFKNVLFIFPFVTDSEYRSDTK